MISFFVLRRKVLFVVISFTFFVVQLAHAADADLTKRYLGSFLAEENSGRSYYWYVHPQTAERYAVNSLNDFSRLLSNVGIGIRTKDLTSIPEASDAPSVDYALVQRFKGRILLQVDNEGRAWFVNPLDVKRYELTNDDAGFNRVKELALDISAERLVKIPITKHLGFDQIDYGSVLPKGVLGIDADTYATMFDILRTNHYYKENFTDQDLFQGSLKGMAEATMDKYTEYFPPDKNKQTQSFFEGGTSIEGIGAILDARDNTIVVVRVLDGPAKRAGLLPKDRIVKVGETPTDGMSVERAALLIRGQAGTTVQLLVLRPSTGATTLYTITREKVFVPSVEGSVLDGDIAYFKFSLFTADLLSQFQPLVNQYVTPNTRGIIIDMRDNSGGVTEAAVQLADYWLENVPVYTMKRPFLLTSYYAAPGRRLPAVSTVILVNEETASASEIFTAALKHYQQAVVVGTKTAGKGTGQTLVNFEDGSGLKYTTFEWLPPNQMSIDGIGLTPDFPVDPGTVENLDPQLEYAKGLARH